MAEKITVPTLGESVTEATVSKWLKSQGESVVADEPIVELETDKVNVEVPSPSNGVLDNIAVKEGETVNVGSLLGTILGSSTKTQNNIKELKNYSPPEKKKETEKEMPEISEIKSLKIIARLLTKNDIGGNIGYYRLLTSLNCKEVHSFEPLYEYECYPIERNLLNICPFLLVCKIKYNKK